MYIKHEQYHTAVLITHLHPVARSIHYTQPVANSTEKTKVKQKVVYDTIHTVLTLHNGTSQFCTMTISVAPATPSPLTRKI